MRPRHALRPTPRGHWLLLCLVLPAVIAALLFEGWTTHEVDAARTKQPCTTPIPVSADTGRPVLRLTGEGVETAAMPPGTAALTFDGGPDPVWTPRLLDLLRRYDARATFFLYGTRAARHPDLVRRIRDAGHEIGSYTYTGASLGSASALRLRMELSLTQTALAGAAGINTRLLRLPHTTAADTLCGAEWAAAKQAAEQGYLLVAADRRSRKAAKGVIRQYSQSDLGYHEAERLLRNPKVERFTTVGEGLGGEPLTTEADRVEELEGKGLILAQTLGRGFTRSMAWTLGAAGVLGVLRLALLAVFARVHVRRRDERRRSPNDWLDVPVTVLVPAYNEESGIGATVASLLASTHRKLQVVVIDDGSADRTAELAESFADPRVTVLRQPNSGKPAALNNGLAHARHDIVVMVDADTVLEPDALNRLIQPFTDPGVGAVSGNTKVANRNRMLGRWQHLEYVLGFNLDRRMFEVLQCMTTVPGAIGAFRRDVLTAVGGVSDDTLAEDTDLTMAIARTGRKVVYQESAIARTEVPDTLRQLWRQRYRWCYGTLQSMWKHRHAVVERGAAGHLGRRGLGYLALFQVLLPLIAPVVDVFAVYGVFFRDPAQAIGVWLAFLAVQLATAAYALLLDGERLRALWALPLQTVVFRQLLYLVVIQALVTALLGTRLPWHHIRRSGTAGDPDTTAQTPHTGRRPADTAAAPAGPGARKDAPADAVAAFHAEAPAAPGDPAARRPPRRNRHRHPRRRLLRRLAAALLATVLAVVLAAAAWAHTALNRDVDLDSYGPRPPAGEGTTYLIVGSDTREGLTESEAEDLHTGLVPGGRTDSMILLHTGAHGATMVSLPRDSWVTIPDHVSATTGKFTPPKQNKLNAAYAQGGPELLARTVEHNTGLRIDHYAEIGLGGFVDVVDAVGGVRMCLEKAVRDGKSGANLPAGCHTLDGAEALAFVRQRHQEAAGDLGRTRNQRKFLAALADRATTAGTLANPAAIYTALRAGLDALVVDDGMSLPGLVSMVRAVQDATGGKGRRLHVPTAAVGIATPKGSAILWDQDKAAELFDDLRDDRPVRPRKSRR